MFKQSRNSQYQWFDRKLARIEMTTAVFTALTLSVRRPSLDVRFKDVRFWRLKIVTRTERIKTFIMAVDPYQRYSNEAERANWKLKKPFGLDSLYIKSSALYYVKG